MVVANRTRKIDADSGVQAWGNHGHGELGGALTTGKLWPDGAECPSGSVILVSGEDDPADTIRPRLDAAGADVSRVHYLQSVMDAKGERGFNLSDIIPLAGLLEKLEDGALIVIDPVSAYLAGTDSHKNADMRALLTPLAQMAAAHNVAIVVVSHLNKAQAGSALSRVTGSLALVAAVRAAYAVVKDLDNHGRRLMLPIKNNLGNDRTGMAYLISEVCGVPYVLWEQDPVIMSADEALAPIADDRQRVRNDASEFLFEMLSANPMSVDEIKEEANRAGYSWATVRRAKAAIGVQSKKEGFGKTGEWFWHLPKPLTHADTGMSTLSISEHLSALKVLMTTKMLSTIVN